MAFVNINHWHILGAGAIGTLWASKFLAQQIPCTVLLTSKYFQEDSRPYPESLTVTELNQRESSYPVTTQSLEHSQTITHLLVCTKSYQTLDAVKSIAWRLAPNAVIVLLQNGMGQHEQVCTHFPYIQLIGATTTQGALLLAPGKVKHTGDGESFFGAWSQSQTIDETIVQQLSAIGMHRRSDIQKILWKKLTINCVINPLTALLNCKNGELLADQYADIINDLCNEIDKVAKAIGWYSGEPTLPRALAVAKATSENISSMCQDIRHNRVTEIQFINGYLKEKALTQAIKVPINNQLIDNINNRETAS